MPLLLQVDQAQRLKRRGVLRFDAEDVRVRSGSHQRTVARFVDRPDPHQRINVLLLHVIGAYIHVERQILIAVLERAVTPRDRLFRRFDGKLGGKDDLRFPIVIGGLCVRTLS